MNRIFRVPFPLLLLCAFFAAFAPRVEAHDPGLSRISVIEDGGVLKVSLEGAASDFAPLLSAAESEHRSALLGLIDLSGGENTLAPDRTSFERLEGDPRWSMEIEGVPSDRELRLTALALDRLPRGHRHYVVFESPAGTVRARALLDEVDPAAVLRAAMVATPAIAITGETSPVVIDEVESEIAPTNTNFRLFVGIGFEHILGGLDHLVFVLAIALTAGTLAARVKMLTGFTIAHSITLALGALGWVVLPGALVEPLIALSIAWLAVEAWQGKSEARRGGARHFWLTFACGLVHGLGFAGALSELGLERGSGFVTSLLGFNVGVELGQILVLLVILPLIAGLGRVRGGPERITRFASAGILVAGSFWFFERVI